MKLILPHNPNSHVYSHIWKRKDDNGLNLCHKCEHPLMYSPDDRPMLLSKQNGRANHCKYYHMQACRVCNQICGEQLYVG